jgi:5'-nucleotidase
MHQATNSNARPIPRLRLALLAGLLLHLVGAAQPRELVALRLIAFNDLHGHLEPGENALSVPDPRQPAQRAALRAGGVAYLASAVRALRAEQPASLLISTGDLVGASPLVSALFRDEPTIEVMNALGLDLNAAGNHEFDHGVSELQRLIAGGCATEPRGVTVSCAQPAKQYEGARFPFLAANIEDARGKLLLPPYVIRSIDGVRVGFIGAVTRATPAIVMPDSVRGWRFGAEATALNRYARQLRADGVNAIVAVVHEGGETDGGFNDCENPRGAIFDILRHLDTAIDVVFSAHTHRAYRCVSDGRVVIQGSSFGRLLSVVDLKIDRASGAVQREQTRARNLPLANGLAPDSALDAAYPPYAPDVQIAAIVEHYRKRVAPLADRPVGRIAAAFERMPAEQGDSSAGRLIADAQLESTRGNGAQIAFTNTGGIRTELRPRAADGAVTYGDIYTMQPFGNALVTLSLTGAQLKSLLESQWRGGSAQPHFLQPSASLRYEWREDAPAGLRIVEESIRIDGKPLQRDAVYRVTVNSYLAAGGDRFRLFLDGTDPTGGPLDVDALARHLQRQSAQAPLAPDRQPRIVRRRSPSDAGRR